MAADQTTAVVEKQAASVNAMDPSESDSVNSTFGGQKEDVTDMKRLGKKQQFTVSTSKFVHDSWTLTPRQRNFGLWSTMGFISVYMATWEIVIMSVPSQWSIQGFLY